MRIVILQHDPIEGPGSVLPWVEKHATSSRIIRLDAGETLPTSENVDVLIILGGPMSVNDEAALPWLIAEKVFIRSYIALGRPLLGICLGAQLIASALGARVYPNRDKEIGWLPIETLAPDAGLLPLPARTTVFQWHGDTFDLPDGATLLARSEACAHQAFAYGDKVLALQFHLETTPKLAEIFVATGANELVPAPYVQTPATILAAPPEEYWRINRLLDTILEQLVR